MMGGVDRVVAIRAALLQGGSLAVLAVALALALPRSFFEDWGWAAGPGVWALCAGVAATVLRLPLVPALAGAAQAHHIPNSASASGVPAQWTRRAPRQPRPQRHGHYDLTDAPGG